MTSAMEKRVFLVEDSATVRTYLSLGFAEREAVEVVGFAETEHSAIAWMKAHTADWTCAVVDMFLKEGTGLGVLAACRDIRQPGQTIVVLTNHATADLRDRCLRLGADAFFDKASETDALVDFCAEHG